MSALFTNPRLFFLVIGVVAAFGAAGLSGVARQEDPSITNIFATVVTPFPGADPARVEALVTQPLEDELREISEIDNIESVSRTGISVISLSLSLYIPDARIEQVWSEVRDALGDGAVSFPSGAGEPELDTDRGTAFTTISSITSRMPGAATPAILRRYGELLQDQLRQVDDTKIVRVFGEETEEVRVTLDMDRLTAVGLSFDQVSAAIARADTKVSAGGIRGDAQDLLVEVAGEIEVIQRVRAVPLATAADGSIIRVADVAEVTRDIAGPSAEIAYTNGERAVLVAARIEDDRQVDRWAADARAQMASFEATLPAGLEHRLLFDQSEYTADRFQELATNMAIGVSLVILVLIISLGWRAALVVASVIPLATLLSISAMQFVGLPVQQMSVTGLIVALGLLVDASIVMTDEIKRRVEAGETPVASVRQAIRRLIAPLLASTVTTVLAFVPMALLPGPAGDFVGSIAQTVIIMLIASLFLALTVAPAVAGWIIPTAPRDRLTLLSAGIRLTRASRLFRASLDFALANRGLAIAGALVLPLMGFLAFPTLTAQFFPQLDRDQFYIQIKQPSGASVSSTEAMALEADAIVRTRGDVRSVHWMIGESAPSFYYNMVMNQDRVSSFAEALVTSASPEATTRLIPYLQAELDARFPGAQVLVRELVQGPPVDAPVELRLVGPDLDVLRRLGNELRQRFTQVATITHARADLEGGEPKAVFEIDEDKARLAGLDLGAVARQLEAGLNGAVGGSLLESTEDLPVRVRIGDEGRDTVEALRNVDVVAAGLRGAASGLYPGIPLRAIGDVTVVPSDSPISRRNGERVNTVQGFVAQGVLPQEALNSLQDVLAREPVNLPPGYRIEVGGDADARAETAANLASAGGFVIILTIVTIFLTFGSYRLSIITFMVAGLSMGLSLLALAIFQYPFGIQALIGAIGSIGVSINAAIIILTALQADENAMAGDLAAVRDVVMRSSRHIISTTITTVGGFIPLILAGGGFWPPFAMAIAGGVLLSMVVSFYFTPPMFVVMQRARRSLPIPAPASA